ncbi:MAG: glycosyltransferase family 4 protein [Deltaproteobacteria bacterium]|nr:glycosyltransferase family 4 protein [Deltaproteobacteria bacterium]
MRVLVVTHYYPDHGGGVEIVAGELAKRLVARGVDVVWAATDEQRPASLGGVAQRPFRAWNFTERMLGFPYPLWSPASLVRLEELVRECDVVHLHDSLYIGNVAAYLWARRLGKPVIVTQHVGPVPYRSPVLRAMLGLANRTLARLVLAGSEQAVFISPRVEHYFSDLFQFARAPLYLANGVDTQRFTPATSAERSALRKRFGWAPDRKVRLFVGRFVEKKGLPFLRELAATRPDEAWVFIGHGAQDPSSWNLPNVEVVGKLPQAAIVDYYRAADTLVLPSVGEGFPLVVQEAMACGLPALISAETMEGAPGATDVIASADLHLESWQAALDRIDALGDDHRRRVAEFAQRWSWDDVVERLVEMYAAVSASGR